ncbi:MAG: hypothetical protein LBC12_07465, partial [Nitrososphaerota archaeon]|nr:hypothetical protein [Nitrososphaerota archaeon]
MTCCNRTRARSTNDPSDLQALQEKTQFKLVDKIPIELKQLNAANKTTLHPGKTLALPNQTPKRSRK